MINQKKRGLALLIDDDEVANFLHKIVLQKSSFFEEVINFEDALLGLDFLLDITNPSEFPELLLVDINMPCISGWQFLEEVLKVDHKIRINTQIVLVSIQFSEEDLKVAENYKNLITILNKPLSYEKMEKLMHNQPTAT